MLVAQQITADHTVPVLRHCLCKCSGLVHLPATFGLLGTNHPLSPCFLPLSTPSLSPQCKTKTNKQKNQPWHLQHTAPPILFIFFNHFPLAVSDVAPKVFGIEALFVFQTLHGRQCASEAPIQQCTLCLLYRSINIDKVLANGEEELVWLSWP